MDDLKEIVSRLLEKKKEGEYWDFKKDWEERDKKADLLHDIICMANNLQGCDAYIIFGIEDGTYNVTGIENSNNRKNSQNIIDFLKDKKFAGGVRPSIDVQTISVLGHLIDVLIIKESKLVPFYLESNYENVRAYHIYTRVGDTNTPVDKSADIDKIEMLWKIRLNVDKSGLNRMLNLLEDYTNWNVDMGNRDDLFYEIDPNYKIKLNEIREYKDPLKDFYTNNYSTLYKAGFIYNNTELCNSYILAVDEFRKFIVLPKSSMYEQFDSKSLYYYYDLNSKDGKLLKLISRGEYTLNSREYYEIPVLFFNTEEERKEYEEYARNNINTIDNKEVNNFIKLMENYKDFNEKHYSYVKSYILFKRWKSEK